MCRNDEHGGRRCPASTNPVVRREQNRAYYLKRKTAGTVGQSLGVKPQQTENSSAQNSPYNSIPHFKQLAVFLVESVSESCEVSLDDATQSAYSSLETDATIVEANRLAQLLKAGFSTEFVSLSGKNVVCEVNKVQFFHGYETSRPTVIKGVITVDGKNAGYFARTIHNRDGDETYVEYSTLDLWEDFQGEKIGSQLITHFDAATRATGVTSVKTYANTDVGGYAWAKAGYDWDKDENSIRNGRLICLPMIVQRLQRQQSKLDDLETETAASQSAEIGVLVKRLNGDVHASDYPTPFEVAMCGRGFSDGVSWVGKNVLLGAEWAGVRTL